MKNKNNCLALFLIGISAPLPSFAEAKCPKLSIKNSDTLKEFEGKGGQPMTPFENKKGKTSGKLCTYEAGTMTLYLEHPHACGRIRISGMPETKKEVTFKKQADSSNLNCHFRRKIKKAEIDIFTTKWPEEQKEGNKTSAAPNAAVTTTTASAAPTSTTTATSTSTSTTTAPAPVAVQKNRILP